MMDTAEPGPSGQPAMARKVVAGACWPLFPLLLFVFLHCG
jgi:hypothetical protein